ncbi:GNAT family N-acetyltransferase [Natrononativus amylolyticus]|uniref:GNAT family N-acetyltransferase n=1 Tax=Natrononativus amylolyticus TaxID=2963434 RepID=UPI0020CD69C7|nr:GNAT family N-acetyltransferase [Natrononativus amylolyticus]
MVTIRPARAGDGEELVTVHVAAIRELGSTAYDDEQIDAWAAGKDPEAYPTGNPDATFVVAERDGRVVGFGHLQRDEREVQAVYVRPDHAGRGIGRALLRHLEATAREAGLDWLTLVASKNAVGFYERCGWDRLETVDHESTGGVVLECVRMERRLA